MAMSPYIFHLEMTSSDVTSLFVRPAICNTRPHTCPTSLGQALGCQPASATFTLSTDILAHPSRKTETNARELASALSFPGVLMGAYLGPLITFPL